MASESMVLMLKRRIQEIDGLLAAMTEKDAEIRRIRGDLDKLRNERESSSENSWNSLLGGEKTLHSSEGTESENLRMISDLKVKLSEAERRTEKIRSELGNCRSEVGFLKERNASQFSTIEELKESVRKEGPPNAPQIQTYKDQIDGLQNQIENLVKNEEKWKSVSEESASKSQEIFRLKLLVSELRSSSYPQDSLKKENISYSREIDLLKEKIQALSFQLTKKTEDNQALLESLQAKNESLESETSQLTSMKHLVESLQCQVSERNNEVLSYKNQISELETESATKSDEIIRINEKVSTLKSTLSLKKNELFNQKADEMSKILAAEILNVEKNYNRLGNLLKNKGEHDLNIVKTLKDENCSIKSLFAQEKEKSREYESKIFMLKHKLNSLSNINKHRLPSMSVMTQTEEVPPRVISPTRIKRKQCLKQELCSRHKVLKDNNSESPNVRITFMTDKKFNRKVLPIILKGPITDDSIPSPFRRTPYSLPPTHIINHGEVLGKSFIDSKKIERPPISINKRPYVDLAPTKKKDKRLKLLFSPSSDTASSSLLSSSSDEEPSPKKNLSAKMFTPFEKSFTRPESSIKKSKILELDRLKLIEKSPKLTIPLLPKAARPFGRLPIGLVSDGSSSVKVATTPSNVSQRKLLSLNSLFNSQVSTIKKRQTPLCKKQSAVIAPHSSTALIKSSLETVFTSTPSTQPHSTSSGKKTCLENEDSLISKKNFHNEKDSICKKYSIEVDCAEGEVSGKEKDSHSEEHRSKEKGLGHDKNYIENNNSCTTAKKCSEALIEKVSHTKTSTSSRELDLECKKDHSTDEDQQLLIDLDGSNESMVLKPREEESTLILFSKSSEVNGKELENVGKKLYNNNTIKKDMPSNTVENKTITKCYEEIFPVHNEVVEKNICKKKEYLRSNLEDVSESKTVPIKNQKKILPSVQHGSLLTNYSLIFERERIFKASELKQMEIRLSQFQSHREFLVKHIQEQLNRLWKTVTKDTFDNIVDAISKEEVLKTDPRVLLDFLYVAVKSEKSSSADLPLADSSSAPPVLTVKQKKIISLIHALDNYPGSFSKKIGEEFLCYLYYALFGRDRMSVVLKLFEVQNLVRIYASVCRILGREELLKTFIYDILFFKNSRNHTVILNVLRCWPDLFTWVGDGGGEKADPILEAFVWIVYNSGPMTGKSDYKVYECRQALNKRCRLESPYARGADLVQKFIQSVKTDPNNTHLRHSTMKALLLVARCQEYRWTNNNLVNPLLLLLSQENSTDAEHKTSLMPWVVDCIGAVSRVYQVDGRSHLEDMLNPIKSLLEDSSIYPELENSCIVALIWLGHHLQRQVVDFLSTWTPKFPLKQEAEKIIKNFLGTRAYKFVIFHQKYKSRPFFLRKKNRSI